MKKTFASMMCVLASTTAAIAADTPKAEVFVGYTYTRFNSATDVPAFSANGGGGQFAVNAGKWFGFVTDLGATHNGNIGGYHLDSTFTNFLFGPRINFRTSRWTPYIHSLFGGVYAATSAQVTVDGDKVTIPPVVNPVDTTAVTPGTAVSLRASSQQTAFAMAFGGGLDVKLSRRVSFRLIGLDYYMTRLQNLRSLNDNNQNNLRFTTGLNFTLGGEAPTPAPPAPPPMKTCWNGSSIPVGDDCPKRVMNLKLGAPQTELCPGASVTVAPSGEVPAGATLQWTVNGQATSEGPSFEFGATGREPGDYTIGVKIAAAEFDDASYGTAVKVLAYSPPTGSLEVSPAEIWAGEPATVAASFTPGRCGGQIRSTEITATEGTVSGTRFDSASVQFDPADNSEQRKTVKFQARAADEHGAGTAEATILVKRKAAVVATRLPDIIFPKNNARVNNCGKRVLLEELKSFLDKDPTSKVVLVGHVDPSEANRPGLDRQRALNSAAVISGASGICTSFPANQILVGAVGAVDNGVDLQPHFCGSSAVPRTAEVRGSAVNESDEAAKQRRVEVWFVPTGGVLPASLKDHQDASALSVSSLGCPK